jgi:hypothetical protein
MRIVLKTKILGFGFVFESEIKLHTLRLCTCMNAYALAHTLSITCFKPVNYLHGFKENVFCCDQHVGGT